jgi:hypothetical protein
MENSNCGCECSFVKSGFCKTDKECPFYVETWWQIEGKQDPKIVKDCFPKKFALEQNHLLHRQLCLQGVVEDVRNRMDRIEQMLINLTSQSKEFINEKSQERLESAQNSVKILDLKKEEKS